MLDVKVGSGAFMNSLEKARELATSLVEVAGGAGLKTTALLTDMDHPLASAAGNAVEMQNAIDFLTGKHIDQSLHDVTVALGAEMLVSGKLVANVADGAEKMKEAFASGRAAEKFSQMVSALGGPNDLVEQPEKYLVKPAVHLVVNAEPSHGKYFGRLAFDTRQVGNAVIELGGGRTRPQDPVDHAVGLTGIARRDWDGSSPLCEIWARDEQTAQKARQRILQAMRVADSATVPALLERISALSFRIRSNAEQLHDQLAHTLRMNAGVFASGRLSDADDPPDLNIAQEKCHINLCNLVAVMRGSKYLSLLRILEDFCQLGNNFLPAVFRQQSAKNSPFACICSGGTVERNRFLSGQQDQQHFPKLCQAVNRVGRKIILKHRPELFANGFGVLRDHRGEKALLVPEPAIHRFV